MRVSRFLSLATLTGALVIADASTALAQNAPDATTTREGALRPRSRRDAEGHFIERQFVRLEAGESVTIRATSTEFDTVLRVRDPDGSTHENDDAEGDGTNSRVDFVASQSGRYEVTITSYRPRETGRFDLVIERQPSNADNSNNDSTATPTANALDATDPVDAEGRRSETRTLTLRAGENVVLTASSTEFDTVLAVEGPSGFQAENDDADGEGTNSRVEFEAPEAGAYRVTVRSYRAGESGAYEFSATRNAGSNDSTQCDGACPTPTTPTTANPPATSFPLQPGQPIAWVYDPTSGRYVPVYSGMTGGPSNVQPPSVVAPSVVTPTFVPPDTSSLNPAVGGTVYGIFVGVSDYGGPGNLQYTAQDARTLSREMQQTHLIRPGNAIVLTDRQATAANVRQAFQTLSQRVTANDTFVFFFDGHGGTNSIQLRSGSMNGNQLASLLDGVRGRQLIVLDSCYAGSLSNVVTRRANRMALFSSRADETSDVATEVRAGGWLAHFVIRAVRDQSVAGNDHALQLNELATYVQRGYNRQVHGQHLVVASGNNARATLWQIGSATSQLAMAD